ncbi:MAG: hypothetical protein ACI9MC_002866 [Kiritimatiellia bacterium]|jgi:hypothetical protein
MKRRWQKGKGRSGRYWEVDIDGSVVLTSTGNVGSPARPRQKDHGDEMEAEFWVEQASMRMEDMGYVEVEAVEFVEVPAPKAMRAAPVAPPAVTATPEPTESLLQTAYRTFRANPEQPVSWTRVLSALQDEGNDGLAGLIRRGLAAENNSESLIDWQRWLRAHRRQLVGAVPTALLQISWRNGLPWSVRIPSNMAHHQASILQAIAQAPICRLVIDLQIQPITDPAELAPLHQLPVLISLRVDGECAHTNAEASRLPFIG